MEPSKNDDGNQQTNGPATTPLVTGAAGPVISPTNTNDSAPQQQAQSPQPESPASLESRPMEVVNETTQQQTLPPQSDSTRFTPASSNPPAESPAATTSPQPVPVSSPPASDAPATQNPVPTPPAFLSFGAQPVISSFAPSQAAGPVVGSSINPNANGMPSPRRNKKKLAVIAGSVTGGVLLLSGLVFGLYLPSTPNGTWSAGLDRTGKAMTAVIYDATEPEQLAQYKTSTITGTVKGSVAGTNFSGGFATTFDKKTRDGGLNITVKDATDSKTLTLKVLSEMQKDKKYPDIFFQVNGLGLMGVDSFYPGLTQYEGKWIVASSEYLESIGDSLYQSDEDKQEDITSEDIAEAARAVTKTTQEYVFTSDKDKVVLTKKKFVGKERVDDMSTYRYEVVVNDKNAKAYCEALAETFMSTKAYKKSTGHDAKKIEEEKKSSKKSCENTVDNRNKDTTYDMWIDRKYKLIYKVRAYSGDDKKAYTEFGQEYKGDDKLALFVNYVDKDAKSEGRITLGTDLKTQETTSTVTFEGKSESNPYDVKINLKATSSDKPVTIEKPTGAIPIQQILEAMGISSTPTSSGPAAATPASVQSKARDSERQADINQLYSNLEMHYAANGYYPALSQINNSAWRAENMPNVDESILLDPEGTVPRLVTSPSRTQYAYLPAKGCDSGGAFCQGYVLTATLSNGDPYSKSNYN